MDWTERHRPRALREVIGNGPVLSRLLEWAQAWQSGDPPARRGMILAGPPGTGKTSTALALARDMGWQAIELNASDARNADTIRKVATAGAMHATFGSDGSFASTTGASKLIILDEADNLYERGGAGEESPGEFGDRGGKAAILETLRKTQQPIILIVNDLYALEKGSGAAFKALADVLKFSRVQSRSVTPMLVRIAAEEGIQVDKAVLEAIAVRSEGDVRSAVRDFESIAMGRTRVGMEDLASLGKRDTETSLFDLMRHILKGRPIADLQREVWSADATPEDLVLWIDENMPREYQDPKDLVAGYEMLSRADMFLGRTRRTQDYGLWAYASELSTLGVSAVRKTEYRGFQNFGFPQYLMRMSRTRGLRQTKDLLAEHLGRATHSSKRRARAETVEPFSMIFQHDVEFARAQTAKMDLTDEELVLLLGNEATAARIKEIRAGQPGTEEVEPGTAKRGKAKGPTATAKLPEPSSPAADDGADESPPPSKPEKPKPAQGQKSLFGF